MDPKRLINYMTKPYVKNALQSQDNRLFVDFSYSERKCRRRESNYTVNYLVGD